VSLAKSGSDVQVFLWLNFVDFDFVDFDLDFVVVVLARRKPYN
jgi:hypothetical protein